MVTCLPGVLRHTPVLDMIDHNRGTGQKARVVYAMDRWTPDDIEPSSVHRLGLFHFLFSLSVHRYPFLSQRFVTCKWTRFLFHVRHGGSTFLASASLHGDEVYMHCWLVIMMGGTYVLSFGIWIGSKTMARSRRVFGHPLCICKDTDRSEDKRPAHDHE